MKFCLVKTKDLKYLDKYGKRHYPYGKIFTIKDINYSIYTVLEDENVYFYNHEIIISHDKNRLLKLRLLL